MANRVPPVLRLAVLCERLEEDADGRPYAFVPVHTLRFPPDIAWGYQPPVMNLYMQLEDAVGTFYLRAVLREQGGAVEVYRADPVEIAFGGTDHRVIPLELGIELTGLVFPRPGVYEIVLYANYASLHGPDDRTPVPFPPVRLTVSPPDGRPGGVL